MRSDIELRPGQAYYHALLEMQFARTAIIIEPIGHVIILLDFHQCHAPADRVHRSCRTIIEATGLDGLPFHQRFDAAIQSRGAQFFG